MPIHVCNIQKERHMNHQELLEAKQTFRLHTLEKEYKSLFKMSKAEMAALLMELMEK